jgi:hypothetical protein
MRTFAAALAVIAMLTSATARAGVVLEQEEAVAQAPGPGGHAAPPRKRTVMVQGHQEKMVIDNFRSVVIDIDKGTMTVLNSNNKTYMESPFPPKGPESQMLKQFMSADFNFKKAGTSRTVLGYACNDYSSSAQTPNGQFSTTSCYSKKAPGAAEYTAFQKAAALKLKGDTAGESGGVLPEGVPLVSHSSRKITGFTMPGMPPEQAKRIAEMMAKRPPVVTDTTVTKISSESLPADTFGIPAGFTKRDMRMGMRPGGPMMRPGMMMKPGPGAPGAPGAIGAPAAPGTSLVPSAPSGTTH